MIIYELTTLYCAFIAFAVRSEYNSYLDPIEAIMQNFAREQESFAQELVAQIPSIDSEPQPSAASQLFRTVSGTISTALYTVVDA